MLDHLHHLGGEGAVSLPEKEQSNRIGRLSAVPESKKGRKCAWEPK